MNTRRITLIVAVVLAVGTGILLLKYLSGLNQQQPQQQAKAPEQQIMVPVVIANRDIPARAKITPDMLTKVTRPQQQVEPQALSDPKQAEGDVALISIPSGSTLTETKIGQPAEVGVTARLKPGMRAVSIPVDRVKAVSNLVQPGDRVDVMAAVNKGPGIPPKTFTIIRGALVLAINSQLEQTQGGATPAPGDAATTVTLGVSPSQADLLTVADLNSTIRLALRSPQEPVNSLPAEPLEFADLGSAANTAQANTTNVPPPLFPIPAPTVAPLKAMPAPPSVPVIDGDHYLSTGT